MKKLIAAAFAACLSLSALAQMMPDSTFQVVAYWSKGDKISYQCTDRTVKKTPDGQEEVQNSSSEVRTFEVIDQTDTTYTLRLTYSDVFSSQLSLPAQPRSGRRLFCQTGRAGKGGHPDQ